MLFLSIVCVSQEVNYDWDAPDNDIYALSADDTYTYYGGITGFIGKKKGYLAHFSKSSDVPSVRFPEVNNFVYDIVSDGNEGWYICGDFTKVGDENIGYLAHINSDFTVDTDFNFNIDSRVISLLLIGDDLYIGGLFTSVGGQGRARLAKIDTRNKTLDNDWTPTCNGNIVDIVSYGSDIYIGGSFNQVNSQSIDDIAKLNDSDGSLDMGFTPNSDGLVLTLYVDDTHLYIGGSFSEIDGQPINNLARVDKDDGTLDAVWDPDPSGGVRSIIAYNNTLIVGGSFINIGGQVRSRLAQLNNTDGSATSWDANASTIYKLHLDGDDLYLGGGFSSIDGNTIYRIGRVDPDDASPDLTWTPDVNTTVTAIATDSRSVVIGGQFSSYDVSANYSSTRINRTTGHFDQSFQVRANGFIYSIKTEADFTYYGGAFISLNSNFRNYIGRVNTSTSAIDSWDPDANGTVYDIEIDGNDVYVSGSFTMVGGQARNNIVKINKATGAVDATFNPNADGVVYDIEIVGDDLYIGGDFSNVGGQARNNIAKLNKTNGNADATFNPNSNGLIRKIHHKDNSIYVGGDFSNVGGQVRNNVAKLNLSDGSADANWNPNMNDVVWDIASFNNYIYAGGEFTSVNGQGRNYLVRLDTSNGTIDTDWEDETNNLVYVMNFNNRGLDIGGDFTNVNDYFRHKIARFQLPDELPRIQSFAVSNVTELSALIETSVDDSGEDAIISLEYGVSSGDYYYEVPVPPTPLTAGSGLTSISYTLSPLEFQRTYYIRLKASNSVGTAYSSEATFTTLAASSEDYDGDGILNEDEALSPNLGDGNGDGIPDSQQSNVVSFFIERSNSYITIFSPDCDVNEAGTFEFDTPPNEVYPYGLIQFKLPCSNATAKIFYHNINDMSAYNYNKLNSSNILSQFPNAEFSTTIIGRNQVAVATLTLTDGGDGDYDGVVNGIIYDPGGPALPITANIPIWDWWYALLLIPLMVYGYKRFS